MQKIRKAQPFGMSTTSHLFTLRSPHHATHMAPPSLHHRRLMCLDKQRADASLHQGRSGPHRSSRYAQTPRAEIEDREEKQVSQVKQHDTVRESKGLPLLTPKPLNQMSAKFRNEPHFEDCVTSTMHHAMPQARTTMSHHTPPELVNWMAVPIATLMTIILVGFLSILARVLGVRLSSGHAADRHRRSGIPAHKGRGIDLYLDDGDVGIGCGAKDWKVGLDELEERFQYGRDGSEAPKTVSKLNPYSKRDKSASRLRRRTQHRSDKEKSRGDETDR
ncbi:hypothetical protein SUNI508_04879 [Seiridium unicorne]|uniref:Uncharacterized protein n=1 Tax=Seiridium unicorne TaxID=138068 RepID=A0ABR2V5M9_9PEZI